MFDVLLCRRVLRIDRFSQQINATINATMRRKSHSAIKIAYRDRYAIGFYTTIISITLQKVTNIFISFCRNLLYLRVQKE